MLKPYLRLTTFSKSLFPGFLVAALIALAGQFISEHYGAPSMLMALLFGIALNFLSEDTQCKAGIAFSARTILRFGVALLGMRISFDMAAQLGLNMILLIVGSVVLTIVFGMLIGRFLGHGPRFSFLSAGSVAICGASAAMAISAILPRDDRSEERLVFTVVGVTLLSTATMIVYPILADIIGFDEQLSGIFIGATIHDVAQVVGAGFSISEDTGEVATLVKLIRVSMLAPVILIASLIVRQQGLSDQIDGGKPPIMPSFIIAFIILVFLNSLNVFPTSLIEISTQISKWALLTAIAAVGLKTSLRDVMNVGGRAIAFLVIETLFIAIIMIIGLQYIGLAS